MVELSEYCEVFVIEFGTLSIEQVNHNLKEVQVTEALVLNKNGFLLYLNVTSLWSMQWSNSDWISLSRMV